MSKKQGWSPGKIDRFYAFMELNKKYLLEYFNEKLTNPIINSPIKSGFFNQMADYVDYDKHCVRQYFHKHKDVIYMKKFGKSVKEYGTFVSYLQRKKKTIKKKRRSNISKSIRRTRRRFNKELHRDPTRLENPGLTNLNSANNNVSISLSPPKKKDQSGSNIVNLESDRIAGLTNSALFSITESGDNGSKNNKNIFIQQSDEKSSGKIINIESSCRSDRDIFKKYGSGDDDCSENKFILKTNSPDNSNYFREPGSANPMEIGSPEWDPNTLCLSSSIYKNLSESNRMLMSSEEKDSSSLTNINQNKFQNPKSNEDLCQWRSNQSTGNKTHKIIRGLRWLSKDDCVCQKCLSDEEYVVRQMRFKTYMRRVKITPEIFENLRKIRFCMDCYLPVLKGVDKNEPIVPEPKEVARDQAERKREKEITQRHYEESIFQSQNSDKIVSETNSEESFKIKLRDNVDKTGIIPGLNWGLRESNGIIQPGQGRDDHFVKLGENLLNQETLKDRKCLIRNDMELDRLQKFGDQMETVKRSRGEGIKVTLPQEPEIFVQEVELSEYGNIIDNISREADQIVNNPRKKTYIKNDRKKQEDAQINSQRLDKTANKSDPEEISDDEIELLKEYLDQIRIENLAK